MTTISRFGKLTGMQLKAYLAENGLTLTAFARSMGLGVQTLHRYVHGRRFPPADVLLRIRNATGGQVTADDFVDQHTAGTTPASAEAA